MGNLDILPDPLKIQGRLIGKWPDGMYRLYIGARQINTQQYAFVRFYDTLQPFHEEKELYLDVQILQDRLYVQNQVYKILPSSVSAYRVLETNCVDSYSLDGLPCTTGNGIRIIHTLRGFRKVLIQK